MSSATLLRRDAIEKDCSEATNNKKINKLIDDEDKRGMELIPFNKLLPTPGMNSRDRSTGKISLGLLMFLAAVGATL